MEVWNRRHIQSLALGWRYGIGDIQSLALGWRSRGRVVIVGVKTLVGEEDDE